jgi:hypothetical protein
MNELFGGSALSKRDGKARLGSNSNQHPSLEVLRTEAPSKID